MSKAKTTLFALRSLGFYDSKSLTYYQKPAHEWLSASDHEGVLPLESFELQVSHDSYFREPYA